MSPEDVSSWTSTRNVSDPCESAKLSSALAVTVISSRVALRPVPSLYVQESNCTDVPFVPGISIHRVSFLPRKPDFCILEVASLNLALALVKSIAMGSSCPPQLRDEGLENWPLGSWTRTTALNAACPSSTFATSTNAESLSAWKSNFGSASFGRFSSSISIESPVLALESLSICASQVTICDRC